VNLLLEQEALPDAILYEAAVYLPKRGRVWIAVFTGASGGQIWRTTGLTNRDEALALARKWEAEARAQRAISGKPSIRAGHFAAGLTQREVGLLLGLSERTVRKIERTALRKLFNDPRLKQLWQQYSSGELGEAYTSLSAAEIVALFGMAQTSEEHELIKKILWLIQR
jgi:hypothetical protein